jgi:hypothetical protein
MARVTSKGVPTPMKTMRLKCLDCCGHQRNEFCGSVGCPLWPYRMGRNPTQEEADQHNEAAHAIRWQNTQMRMVCEDRADKAQRLRGEK